MSYSTEPVFRRLKKPPTGLKPRYIWREENPSPTTEDRIRRFVETIAAECRYEIANRRPPYPVVVERYNRSRGLTARFLYPEFTDEEWNRVLAFHRMERE